MASMMLKSITAYLTEKSSHSCVKPSGIVKIIRILLEVYRIMARESIRLVDTASHRDKIG